MSAMLDLVLREVRLAGREEQIVDLGIVSDELVRLSPVPRICNDHDIVRQCRIKSFELCFYSTLCRLFIG